MAPGSNSDTPRLHHLDSLRAFIMSMGVVLHAGAIDRFWLSDSVGFVSGLFRMKLFILIAGFFAALLSERRGMATVQRERIVRFGLPSLVFILLMNPVANFYSYKTLVAPVDFTTFMTPGFDWSPKTPDKINWHLHLWFLLVVLAYCLALPLFRRVADSAPIARGVAWLTADSRSPALAGFVLAMVMTFTFLAGRTLHFLTFQHFLHGGPLNFLVQAILWYPPYFLLGMVAYRNRAIFDLLHRVSLPQVVFALALISLTESAYAPLKAHFGLAVAETVEHLGRGCMGYYICMMLLAFFAKAFGAPNTVTRFLSNASYTVYLFHFGLLAITQYYLMQAGFAARANYFASMLIVYPACLLLHRCVVDTGPIPRLLLNGVIPKPLKALPPAGQSESLSSAV